MSLNPFRKLVNFCTRGPAVDSTRRFQPDLETFEGRCLPVPRDTSRRRPASQPDREVTVMSRNLYVGTDLQPIVDATLSFQAGTGSLGALIGSVSTGYAPHPGHELPGAGRGPGRRDRREPPRPGRAAGSVPDPHRPL